MVKKAKQTAKKTTTKKENKKCPTSTKVAIIAVIAAVAILAAVLIFVMFFKGKKYNLTCNFDDGSGTTIQEVYSYNFDTSKPYNIYELRELTAASEEEATENAELLQKFGAIDGLYVTFKAWSDGNKVYAESNSDQEQIKVAAEDEDIELVLKSLDDTKKEIEEYGFVCEVTK